MGSPFKSTFDLAISGLVYVEFLATRPTTFNSISGTYKCIAESAGKKSEEVLFATISQFSVARH